MTYARIPEGDHDYMDMVIEWFDSSGNLVCLMNHFAHDVAVMLVTDGYSPEEALAFAQRCLGRHIQMKENNV